MIDLDEPSQVLTVEPWPDSSVHPVKGPRQPSPSGNETWSELDAMQAVWFQSSCGDCHKMGIIDVIIYYLACCDKRKLSAKGSKETF